MGNIQHADLVKQLHYDQFTGVFTRSIGDFQTKEAASSAYLAAKLNIHTHGDRLAA